MTDFDDTNTIGYLTAEQLADYLDLIGDADEARNMRKAGAAGQGLGRVLGKAYAAHHHVYGFIEAGEPTAGLIEIVAAASVPADKTLVGTRIKVSLDGFRVEEYPGLGEHTVLFDFAGREQAGDEKQDLRFATVLRAHDRDNAGTNGEPIFTGLTVPADGISFRAKTINIRSKDDEAIITALDSSVFRDGLKLFGTLQPGLPQFVTLAAGVTKALSKRSTNREVQVCELGLDFSDTRTSNRLRLGSYVVIQVPDATAWNWADWRYDPNQNNVVRADGSGIAPFNAIIFSVAVSEESEARSAIRTEGRDALNTKA